jgi:hypothetical protein
MAQHDQVIDDDIGLPVRLDINAALAAIFSSSAGATEPDVIVPGQLWFDTSGGTGVVKLRNAANTGWKVLSFGAFDGSTVYTRAEMEARFQPLAITYTMSQSDALFNQLSYTKPELDAKFATLLDATFAPSAAPTKKTHFDLTPILAGQDRAILVPDKPGLTLGGWELIVDEEFAGVTLGRDYIDLGAFTTLQIEAELWPVSANAIFDMYFSTDNGASWITSAVYYYTYLYANSTQAQGSGLTGQTRIPLTINNNQLPGASIPRTLIDMKLQGFNKARWSRGRMMHSFGNAAGIAGFFTFETSIGCASSVVNNALRIGSAGVAFNGHVTIHGLRG